MLHHCKWWFGKAVVWYLRVLELIHWCIQHGILKRMANRLIVSNIIQCLLNWYCIWMQRQENLNINDIYNKNSFKVLFTIQSPCNICKFDDVINTIMMTKTSITLLISLLYHNWITVYPYSTHYHKNNNKELMIKIHPQVYNV